MYAAQVSGVINAPVQVSGLPFTAIASGREVANSGLSQVTPERIARKGWAPFVSAGIGSSTWNSLSGEGLHGSQRFSGVGGVTYSFGNGVAVGAAGGYQNTSRAMSGTTIEIEGTNVYGTVFAGADIGSVFGNASLTLGSVDYDRVVRQTKIGNATFENTGQTDGSVYGASFEIGARAISTDMLSAGPIASLDHWSADVGAYNEDGWAATGVDYDTDLNGSSTRASVGLFLEGGDLDYEAMPTVFRVKALYTRELDTDPLNVTARAQSSPDNSFTREGRSAQADSLTIGAQLLYNFGPAIASLNYDVRIGEADDHSGSIDISFPLGGE
jgi:outer membrane lipase/esterase